MGRFGRWIRRLRVPIERVGFAGRYRVADITYRFGIATPKRTVAGRYRSYEPTNAHCDDPGLAALSELPDDATIVDIGGHTGEYAVPLAVETNRRVVSFEPNGRSLDRLRRTVELNGVEDRVTARRIGIGSVDGDRTLYRSTYSKLSAFDRDAAERWGADVEAVETVPVRRLDSLVPEEIPPPDGIKIDVEGGEMDVLQGAAGTIDAYRPLIVVEKHDEATAKAIERWLLEREYTVASDGDTLVCRPE